MPNNIKYYFMAFLGFLTVVFWALLQSEKKERAQDSLRQNKAARVKEKEDARITMEGLKNEKDAIDAIDVNDDDKFV